MNILIVFPWPTSKTKFNHPEQIASGGCWSFVHAFRSLGHNVKTVNLYSDAEQWDQEAAEQNYQRESKDIDFAVVFEFGNLKIPYKRLAPNCPVYYHAGDLPQRDDANRDCIKEGDYDGLFVSQLPFVDKYAELYRLPTKWMPYHYDSYLHYPDRSLDKLERFDFVFIGKVYGEREKHLKAFEDNGVKLLYSNGLFGHLYRQSFCRGAVGWTHAWCGEVGYRHFEIPAMGLPLICDKLSDEYGMFKLFKKDDIVIYESVDEAVDKMKYMLEHPVETQSMAKRCMEHTRKHHGSLRRAQQMVEAIEKWQS